MTTRPVERPPAQTPAPRPQEQPTAAAPPPATQPPTCWPDEDYRGWSSL